MTYWDEAPWSAARRGGQMVEAIHRTDLLDRTAERATDPQREQEEAPRP
jgi:hypothetical protein